MLLRRKVPLAIGTGGQLQTTKGRFRVSMMVRHHFLYITLFLRWVQRMKAAPSNRLIHYSLCSGNDYLNTPLPVADAVRFRPRRYCGPDSMVTGARCLADLIKHYLVLKLRRFGSRFGKIMPPFLTDFKKVDLIRLKKDG